MCNHNQKLTTKQEVSGREFYRQLEIDERAWKREIKKIFNKQGRKLIEGINEIAYPPAILDELNKYIKIEDLQATYIENYTKRGLPYYTGVRTALQKKQPYNFKIKEDLDPTDIYYIQMQCVWVWLVHRNGQFRHRPTRSSDWTTRFLHSQDEHHR